MQTYFFEGIVLPERAQLTLKFSCVLSHITSGCNVKADVSIILNQVVVWVDTDEEWDIFDLRNVVKVFLQNELAILGYLKGYAYDLEIKRVLNRALNIDYVFGIEIPCIEERNKLIDIDEQHKIIGLKLLGREGILLHRCFNDLVMAMKNPDDTGFYCYRAIESLRHHCIIKFDMPIDKKQVQWQKLREIAGCDEKSIRDIQSSADAVRHGDVVPITSQDREALFMKTWDIVDGYIKNI